MSPDEGKVCAVTVNNARTELDIEWAGRGKVEAGIILEKAGYGTEEYDLFVADDSGSEPLASNEEVAVAEVTRFHAVRKSNPYGS